MKIRQTDFVHYFDDTVKFGDIERSIQNNLLLLGYSQYITDYSNVPNKHAYMFISGKVCLLGSIKVKRQTLPEIKVYTCLFSTLE